MYEIISSGSKGNAVLYFDSILLDCGVSFALLKEHISKLKLVLLTHSHGDHLNTATIKRLSFERPALRFGCGEFLVKYLSGICNVDVYQAGKIYDYGLFKISPIILYHDVQNFGYRIFMGDKKIIHATDTFTLEGISAKNYDLYALEVNYDEEHVYEVIEEKKMRGEYAHQRGSINSHLSNRQAQDFILKNAGDKYNFVMLHQSSEY